ncbi:MULTISPECIES: phosphoribosylformylglycinamidine synthase subunit PurL [Hyphomonas]|uniref:Phosphoribosylformylglycinamidine synthase subunit PurL n=1 Tax=Hyphomonas adhaerens TaxID=81029 RepID=A0A3B9H2J8_9PROT|nr:MULTISPECIES: phosphoribosylformylglycinamidine synthase subunit PurL [Hyphomonas]MBB41055.1 phosphoribosylformylglycinamidine synthase II [Hyphomonas sp.]HAE28925.1 phosphoribosylformylglycinamidine synthase subunit PurL [Hyphomonas adhaerens]|tara:strand:- start:5467 stop:7743 length:2277 start_codon:yes stop_codon:yes gene_type:complete
MTDTTAILDHLTAEQNETAGLEHGIKADEWDRLITRLGRKPNLVELGIYSVMWSEHCSYKSSRRHLSKFPTKNARVIQGPGENAGVIDIGDGQAAIFKMESHNHPSYIEPYQGAATGVGGILRDVFTMGARPIALVNALRFGSPDHPKTRSLVAGVVAGIGGYGNCVGVPTVAGETQFDAGYNGNILVNAMAVGLADQDKIFYARGATPGNPIFYVGSKTGRDGIHGATMASAEFSEGDEEKRPTVQVGDPFTEKLLIEACLELMATDAIQAIQDMGAAGLTSSSVEMAASGGENGEGIGVVMDLDKVPQREEGMTAYEIMLSESQERMLMVLYPDKIDVAKEIFNKYDLDAEVIGETTNNGHLVLKQFGQIVCDIPVAPLADDAPNYDRPWNEPPKRAPLDISKYPEPSDYGDVLLKLMSCPDMASKRWVWEQYDRHVMGDTVDSSQSGGDAAIVRVHDTNKALAICSDCNPHYVAADPYEGGKAVVAEAYRNLCAVGASPIAITDNLNFGNPEKPNTMGYIVKAIEGMAEACRELDFPVVSGNVSLYNETDGVAIPPTPVVGGVGLIDDLSETATLKGAQPGDMLYVIGNTEGVLGASLYARVILGLRGEDMGAPPPVNLTEEVRIGEFVRSLIKRGLVHAVHDVSDGGIACAATEMALASGCGVSLVPDREPDVKRAEPGLFGEDQGRYLIAATEDQCREWKSHGFLPAVLGKFGGDSVILRTGLGQDGVEFAVPLKTLRDAHEGWLPGYMNSVG